ncbi:DUF6283 family protein [Streptomyces cyaneofuscatus]|uniref:DUF6283 family protein n=1 Tax=Streptomyces cyaneofuscatus TaxID=66883 RepID=UPI003668730F
MSKHQDDHPDAEPGSAAPAPPLYKSGSELDQQVRARLAELGVASGAQMEEVLRQLAEANTALGLDRQAPPEDDSVPGPRAARVVRERPGDDNWQVEARAYQGAAAAQPRPCAGDKVCPWRRDAPAGQFPPAVFEHSAPGNRTAGPRGGFGCHSSPADRSLLCAGWLLAGADGNSEILERMDSGVLSRPKLPAGVKLYASYAEMAIANGVDPDLSALYAGPAPDEDGADLVPLRRFIEDHHALEAAEWAEDLEHELKRSMPPGALLLLLDCDGTALELKLLGVEADHRGQSHATRVLARICAEADARELAVVCTPTHKYGAAEHAWCLTGEGQVADPALPDGHAALYWGLPLAETFRAEHRRTRGDDAVLTYGTDPSRAQLNEVLRAELPATALSPPHPAAQTLQET